MPTTHGAGVGQSPSPLRSCRSAEGGVRPCGALLPPRPLTEAEQKLAHLLLLQAPPPEPRLPQGQGPKALVCAQSGRRGPSAANSSTWGSIGVTTPPPPAGVSLPPGVTRAGVHVPVHICGLAQRNTPQNPEGRLSDPPGWPWGSLGLSCHCWTLEAGGEPGATPGDTAPGLGLSRPREECVPGTPKSL